MEGFTGVPSGRRLLPDTASPTLGSHVPFRKQDVETCQLLGLGPASRKFGAVLLCNEFNRVQPKESTYIGDFSHLSSLPLRLARILTSAYSLCAGLLFHEQGRRQFPSLWSGRSFTDWLMSCFRQVSC